jgi:hypothetical protein
MCVHVLDKFLAYIEEASPSVAPCRPIVRMQILDEINTGFLEAVGEEAIEAHNHVRTTVTAIVNN